MTVTVHHQPHHLPPEGTEDMRLALAADLDRMGQWPTTPDQADPRTTLIEGLHQLADWLASHAEIATWWAATGPCLRELLVCCDAAQLAVIAAATGITPEQTGGGHLVITQVFGPWSVRWVHIPQSAEETTGETTEEASV